MMLHAGAGRHLDRFRRNPQPQGAELQRLALELVRGHDHCDGVLCAHGRFDLADRIGAILPEITENTNEIGTERGAGCIANRPVNQFAFQWRHRPLLTI